MTETNAPIAIKSSQIHASIIPPAGNDDNVPFSARELQLLYEEIFKDRKKKEDWRDDSRHPSYTNFTVPYHFKCRDRYHESKKEYEEQFQHEINQLMNNLNTAYEAARFNRYTPFVHHFIVAATAQSC
ncbi:uncharacterized protein LOC105220201 isoform X2 [Zeugodacus cucurbitae]|uniref:uncharacterized protein LOC105220201 isoform X2 n=1 Tax=Zeugodacus cucurbitae TaxID=28588 RepID=UPI0010A73D77|nr:uncharacterized protein LOC105220201 isoform X2 [Zeugodacus cucurbitae]